MKSKTIKDVIIQVLAEAKVPLTSKNVYDSIIAKGLYEFRSMTPESIVNSELRKNSEGIDLKKSSKDKVFKIVEGNKFTLI